MKERIRLLAALALIVSAAPAFGGSILWRQMLDGGAPDEGMGIKADAAGNAYVAWMTYLAPRAWLMVARLDANGQEQWRASLPVAVAGPPQSGSCRIAVAGEDTYVVCHEDASDRLAFAARVAANGSVAWTAALTDIYRAQDLESDATGAYLVGANTTGQLTLKKLDSNGIAWSLPIVNQFGADRPMSANRLVVTGNDILVTGRQETTEFDYGVHRVPVAFALRCGVDGTLRWLSSVTSTNRLNSFASGIAQTGNGDIVVGGSQVRFDTNGIAILSDNLLVRFDANGNELLRSTVPKAGFIFWVLPHTSGDVLTVGNDSPSNKLRIARVSPDGAVLWRQAQNSDRPVFGDFAAVAVLDANLVVAGYDQRIRNLYMSRIDIETGKGKTKMLKIPGTASRNSRRDFGLDTAGDFYFLTGDGTPWPNVVAVKYRGAAQ